MKTLHGPAAILSSLLLLGCVPPPPASAPPTKTPTTKPDAPAPTPTPTTPSSGKGSACGNVTEKGSCTTTNGRQIVRSCDTSTSQLRPEMDCTALNQVCIYDSTGTAVCQAPSTTTGKGGAGSGNGTTTTSGGCGTLTYAGTCNGNTIHYCLNNVVTNQPCSGGDVCTTDGSCGGTGAECCPVNHCGTLTYEGVCSNSTTVHYCDNGMVSDVHCAAGNTCQIDAIDGAVCKTTTTTGGGGTIGGPCGSVTSDGYCTSAKDGVIYCNNGTLELVTCSPGDSCQLTAGSTTNYDCVTAPSGKGCGAVTAAGTCQDATTLLVCESGVLSTLPCQNGTLCLEDITGGASCQ